MKQQKQHNKTEKDLFDTLYSWIILVVIVICFLDMRIEEEMICNFTWWYLAVSLFPDVCINYRHSDHIPACWSHAISDYSRRHTGNPFGYIQRI